MQIHITGATGRLGSAFLEFCKKKKVKAVPLSREALQEDKIAKALSECEVLVHLAGSTAFWNPRELWEGNVVLSKRIAKALPREAHVVLASSISVYGALEGEISEHSPTFPNTDYGKTKLESERAFSPFSLTTLRIAPIYGPQFPDYFKLLRLVKHFAPVIGSGQNRVPFVHVEDVCSALLTAALKRKKGVFNISGECLKQKEIYRIACETLGVKARFVFVPKHLAHLAGKLADLAKKIGLKTPFSSEHIRILSLDRHICAEKAKRDLAFKPRTLKEGIKEMVEIMERNYG